MPLIISHSLGDVLRYLVLSFNLTDIQFTIMYKKEKHQILTVEKLEPAYFGAFLYKKLTKTIRLTETVSDSFSVNRLALQLYTG